MIAKKIKNPNTKSSKATRIRKLSDYIIKPELKNKQEKCIYANFRGFICETHSGRVAEMIALAEESVRSKDPINHYVVSWKQGEQPTPEQIERAVDIYLKELGLEGHQVIYGLHSDTDNIHLHIEVNRVHPDTLKVIEPNKGFDIEAIHRATAKIEKEQGWQREENGRYIVLENGDTARSLEQSNKPKKPKQTAIDKENLTGEKSAQRIAQERGTEIIKNAKTWQQLHKELEEVGLRYERFGSGAKIYLDDIALKAGDVYRPASLSSMQKKLGPYEPKLTNQSEQNNARTRKYFNHTSEPYPVNLGGLTENGMRTLSQCRLAHNTQRQVEGVLSVDARAYRQRPETMRRDTINRGGASLNPEAIKDDMPGLNQYINLKKDHYLNKDKANIELQKKHEAERKSLHESQQKQRSVVLSGRWKGKGELLNAQRSVLAAEHAADKANLRDQHKLERKQLQKNHQPYPNFEKWLRDQERPDLAEQWRHRATQDNELTPSIGGDTLDPPKHRDIRDFKADIQGGWVHYSRNNQPNNIGFIDKGARVDVQGWKDENTTLAALQLSAQKWGSFSVTGNDEYKDMCVKLAAEHGFKISNPDLQTAIEQEKNRLTELRKEAMKKPQLKDFEAYHEAIGADRYRVTVIKMHEDGSKKVFVLDKSGGVSKGFTPEQMQTQIPKMIGLQNRGENLFYTPLSDTQHHLIVDDLSPEKLEQLINDGHQPAVILESSPGNYQAIITIPKLDSTHNDDVSNQLVKQLNEKYGDPKFSGCIHPHRCPGFENRKLKHKQADGSYPEVKLLQAKPGHCEKTLSLANELNDKQIQAQTLKPKQDKHISQIDEISRTEYKSNNKLEKAYLSHFEHIKTRQTINNFNNADIMIAVRLRSTGHSKSEVQNAIFECARMIRPEDKKNSHNWDDYSRRTADCAFGPKGDADLEKYAKYKREWIKIEGGIQKQKLGGLKMR